jgi:hypothetical protein
MSLIKIYMRVLGLLATEKGLATAGRILTGG